MKKLFESKNVDQQGLYVVWNKLRKGDVGQLHFPFFSFGHGIPSRRTFKVSGNMSGGASVIMKALLFSDRGEPEVFTDAQGMPLIFDSPAIRSSQDAVYYVAPEILNGDDETEITVEMIVGA